MDDGEKIRALNGLQDLLADLEAFEATPESVGYDLRNDLAAIILRHLDGKNWTQKRLAEAMGIKPPIITKLVHSATNCTFAQAGKVLHALGAKARLVEIPTDTAHSMEPITFNFLHVNAQIKEAEYVSQSAQRKAVTACFSPSLSTGRQIRYAGTR